MKRLLALLFLGLASFTRLDFNEVMLGTDFRDIIACYGDPYAVTEPPCGGIQLEYIERIVINDILIYENHYYLLIQDDILVSKCFREEDRPAYDEMYQRDPNYPNFP